MAAKHGAHHPMTAVWKNQATGGIESTFSGFFGKPEIFNTGPGSQFTSFAFTSMLRKAEVRISMDGPGRWMTYYNTHSGLAGRTLAEAYRRIGRSDQTGGMNDNWDGLT